MRTYPRISIFLMKTLEKNLKDSTKTETYFVEIRSKKPVLSCMKWKVWLLSFLKYRLRFFVCDGAQFCLDTMPSWYSNKESHGNCEMDLGSSSNEGKCKVLLRPSVHSMLHCRIILGYLEKNCDHLSICKEGLL